MIKCNILNSTEVLVSDSFYTHGDTHSSTNAERCNSLTPSGPLESMQQGHQHSAARHANRMAQRNGTTAHIHLKRKGQG